MTSEEFTAALKDQGSEGAIRITLQNLQKPPGNLTASTIHQPTNKAATLTLGGGSLASDSSGNGNTASLQGAQWASGMYGDAISLSGSGYLTVNESKQIAQCRLGEWPPHVLDA